jgi:hypothetical protein
VQSPLATARYPDPAYPDINCVCTGDHCNGLPNGPACRGNADSGADTTSPDDRPADAYNAFTIARLDTDRCCEFLTNRDTGDETDHRATAARPANWET